jgi:hypothetical protein
MQFAGITVEPTPVAAYVCFVRDCVQAACS